MIFDMFTGFWNLWICIGISLINNSSEMFTSPKLRTINNSQYIFCQVCAWIQDILINNRMPARERSFWASIGTGIENSACKIILTTNTNPLFFTSKIVWCVTVYLYTSFHIVRLHLSEAMFQRNALLVFALSNDVVSLFEI